MFSKYDEPTAKCIDNTGIQDKFDIGLEYVYVDKKDDFYTILDKYDKACHCISDRFELNFNLKKLN